MKIKRYLLTIIIFFFFGCEDDAILEPQTEQEEQGSYGNLSLPNEDNICLLYTSPSPRDRQKSRMAASA